MLAAVRALCLQHDVPAQLALEAPMGCGFGACFGCAVPTRSRGLIRLCLEGPVLDAADWVEVADATSIGSSAGAELPGGRE